MKQSQYSHFIDDDSVLERPRVALLDEKHWLYLQRRYRITPRELEVAKLFCQGSNNGEIVEALKIRHGTVKTHLRNIYRKIRVKNKIEMLLKFVDDAIKFSVKSGTTPPIPIIDPEKINKNVSIPSE